MAGAPVLYGRTRSGAETNEALERDSPVLQADAKIGILAGSLASGLLGAVILFRVPAETARKAVDDLAVPVPS